MCVCWVGVGRSGWEWVLELVLFFVDPPSEMSNEQGQSWLESTAMARHSLLLETAGNYLRMAEMHPVPGLHLEQAKILHAKVCVCACARVMWCVCTGIMCVCVQELCVCV